MKFLQPIRRTVLSITLAIALSVFGSWFILGGGTTKIDTVSANSSDNLSGWAWSGYDDGSGNVGVGWISFNSTDCDTDSNNYVDAGACGGIDNATTPVVNYGVKISPLTGTGYFSGYAWSSNIGWISFNSGETASCGGGAQIDWATGAVTGWAKALAATGSGNWDGCISLSGDWDGDATIEFTDGPDSPDVSGTGDDPVRLNLVTKKFDGYAWGGNEVVGWIDWNPAGGGVKMPPECSDTIDNDGNGLVDAGDPGCWTDPANPVTYNSNDNDESNTLPQCSDWIDNDIDGVIDFPADNGCTNISDNSEQTPQCNDGIDNDGDGTWDFGGANPDTGCSSAADNTERDFKFKEF